MGAEDRQLPVSVALVGAGMVAGTHVAACLAAREKVRLVGVSSRRPDRAQEFAQEIAARAGHDIAAYPDVTAIARDPQLDFVIVATPPDARIDLIQPLAAVGKHILLEKPVARTAAEAAKVVRVCEAAGVKLGIVFQHRMRAASRRAAELAASGNLGNLALVEISVPWWREQSYYDEPGRGTYARDGGGVLISQAIHTIDLALSMTGPVASVQAMTATTRLHRMEAEDFAVAGLTFTNGAVGSLVASTASFPGATESIVLHFQAATLRLATGRLHVHWHGGREEVSGAEAGTGGGADPMAFTHEWHQAVIEDFADAITSGRDPAASGRAALAVHYLIEAITRSASEGRAVELH